jgi:hypothetical protein
VILKKITMISTVLALIAANGCAGWTINGIPAETFKRMKPVDYGTMAAGAASNFLIHWLGHVAYLEAKGFEWEQKGLYEEITQPISETQRQWAGRTGFLAQLIAGVFLSYDPWDLGYFETGYHFAAMLQIATYPSLHKEKGDLDLIGKNRDTEWVTYAFVSSWLLGRNTIAMMATDPPGLPPKVLPRASFTADSGFAGFGLTAEEIEQITRSSLLSEKS